MLRSLERSLSVGGGYRRYLSPLLGGGPLEPLVPLGTFHCYLKIVYLGLIAGLVPNWTTLNLGGVLVLNHWSWGSTLLVCSYCDNDLEWSDPFDSSSLISWERIAISPHLQPVGQVFHVLRVRFLNYDRVLSRVVAPPLVLLLA